MIIGVPRERKVCEQRVAITPAGTYELTSIGHAVLIESGAGAGSAFADLEYVDAGAVVVAEVDDVFERSDLVCKVKEPLDGELKMMRPRQILFTYLHIAAYPHLGQAVLESGITAIGYETVGIEGGPLPLLAPMSEIAGRIAAQAGAHHLEHAHGGRGVLMGGVSGVMPAQVAIVGAGMAGSNAAKIAAGMQARVTVLDIDIDKLRSIDALGFGQITTLASNRSTLCDVVATADLVIGAVLVPGRAAPKLITADHIAQMRTGSVVVDVAIDQGGCIETSHETSHDDPIFVHEGIVHYAVGNIPAAVPHTSTQALTNVTLPYLTKIATLGIGEAVRSDAALERGVQFCGGEVTSPDVATALGRHAVSINEIVDDL